MEQRAKNIVIVSHYYPPHIGGLEIVAFNQATRLAAAGNAVTVITSRIGSSVSDETVDGVRILRVPAWNIFEQWGIPFPIFSPAIVAVLRKTIKSADIVHIHDVFYVSSFLAALVAVFYKKTLVVTQHVALVKHSNSLVIFIQHIAYATWGKFVFENSKKIVVYNNIVKQFLLAQSYIKPGTIVELRNGIDLSLFHPAAVDEKAQLRNEFNLPFDKPIALFVGRLVTKKGFMKLLNAHDAAYDLVFAGPGEVSAEWKNKSGIHILGSVNQGDLAKLYRACDLFVFPSEGEMFTLSMQEAMASGLPIVTTDEAGYREYELDRDLIAFVPPTSADLKSAMLRLIADADLMERMSVYSISLAKKWFDSEENMKDMFSIYSSVGKKQKIVFVSDAVYPFNKGGKEKRLYEISRRLVGEGREIHIYTMQWWDGPKDIVHEGVNLHAICKLHPLYHNGRRSIAEAIWFSIAVFKLLFVGFDTLDVDHIPFFPLFSARIVTWLRGKKLYATWHEVWGHDYWNTYLGSPVSALLGAWTEWLSFRLPDLIIANSEHTARKLRMAGVTCEVRIVSLGADLASIYVAPPAATKTDVIFVGRLLGHKGVDLLVSALQTVKATYPNIKALIIGSGPEKESIESLIATLDLNGNITLLDGVEDHATLYGLMKSSKMLVLPSVREGFGLVVVEANAAGIPVITTRHADNAAGDLIEDGVNGFLAEPKSEDIAAKILQIMQDGPLMQPQRDIVQYDWNTVVQKFEKVFI